MPLTVTLGVQNVSFVAQTVDELSDAGHAKPRDVAAKVAHLNLLPQGQPERYTRVVNMVEVMESFFGSCTNHGECEKACPKEISIDFIAYMNRDYIKAKAKNRKLTVHIPAASSFSFSSSSSASPPDEKDGNEEDDGGTSA